MVTAPVSFPLGIFVVADDDNDDGIVVETPPPAAAADAVVVVVVLLNREMIWLCLILDSSISSKRFKTTIQ